MRANDLATLLAISGVAILAACSMFGGRQASGPATHQQKLCCPHQTATSPAQSASGWQNGELSPNMMPAKCSKT